MECESVKKAAADATYTLVLGTVLPRYDKNSHALREIGGNCKVEAFSQNPEWFQFFGKDLESENFRLKSWISMADSKEGKAIREWVRVKLNESGKNEITFTMGEYLDSVMNGGEKA